MAKQLLFEHYGKLWDMWKVLGREGLLDLRKEVEDYIEAHKPKEDFLRKSSAGIPYVDSEKVLEERKKALPKLWEWVETYPDPNVRPDGSLHWDVGQRKRRSRSGMVQVRTYLPILRFFKIEPGTNPLWGYSGYSYDTVRNGRSYPSYLPYNGKFEFETVQEGNAEQFPIHLITLVGWK